MYVCMYECMGVECTQCMHNECMNACMHNELSWFETVRDGRVVANTNNLLSNQIKSNQKKRNYVYETRMECNESKKTEEEK